MATRSKKTWKSDSRGYFTRQIGWKRTPSGKLQQHKFILGTDRREAETRERKLRELWETYERMRRESRPVWPDDLLEIAKLVAKGAAEAPVSRKPRELNFTYAGRVRRLQSQFPVICFVPEDRHAYDTGLELVHGFEAIPAPREPFVITEADVDPEKMKVWLQAQKLLESIGLNRSPSWWDDDGNFALPTPRQSELPTQSEPITTKGTGSSSPSPVRSTSTLHQAMTAYQAHIRAEFYRAETGQLTAWGQKQIDQVGRLMQHHPNALLDRLDYEEVTRMIQYWCRRPIRQRTGRPMTHKSCRHYLSALKRFFDWLHQASSYEWRKPEDYGEIKTRVQKLPQDLENRTLEQVETFSLDELRLLMRYAQPFDRVLILLALNCGFGQAEVSSLLVREIRLFEAHSPRDQEILAYLSTDADSFIKRIRRKNEVYGEHILFPLTVQGIEWALERRQSFPDPGDGARLLVNDKGKPLDARTASGNAGQQIPNRFSRLIKRIQDDGNEIQKLSFNKLRKTASQLIRQMSDGEVMAVFDCHGTPVKSDELADLYSNRPFGKVFKAIRAVEAHLEPVFREAGSSPFATQPQAYTGRQTIERLLNLHNTGMKIDEIAESTGVSASTVTRHIRRSKHAGPE